MLFPNTGNDIKFNHQAEEKQILKQYQILDSTTEMDFIPLFLGTTSI